jgi:hypothetical protein
MEARGDFFDPHFTERTFHQCAYHQPNHLVEETLAIELDPDTRTVLPDTHGINAADCSLVGFAAIGRKTAKVMSANEMFRGCFQ